MGFWYYRGFWFIGDDLKDHPFYVTQEFIDKVTPVLNQVKDINKFEFHKQNGFHSQWFKFKHPRRINRVGNNQFALISSNENDFLNLQTYQKLIKLNQISNLYVSYYPENKVIQIRPHSDFEVCFELDQPIDQLNESQINDLIAFFKQIKHYLYNENQKFFINHDQLKSKWHQDLNVLGIAIIFKIEQNEVKSQFAFSYWDKYNDKNYSTQTSDFEEVIQPNFELDLYLKNSHTLKSFKTPSTSFNCKVLDL